jgi:glycerophosphoryl diester phosphodiesterase
MTMKYASIALLAVVALAVLGAQTSQKKILVAHRGASAYAPEHTIAAYTLAMEQGADFVEQDLAVTKDGVLVCIHDLTLERTTDVEEVFPDRFVEVKDGPRAGRHWLVNDFTLAEIKRLDAGSWFDKRFAGARIPAFQEAIDLVKGRAGMYPELKDPEFYRDRRVDQDRLFADIVRKNGLERDPKTPLIVQSFDDVTLRRLAKDLPLVPRVYLVGIADAWRVTRQTGADVVTFGSQETVSRLDSPDKLRAIAAWATGIGPAKQILVKTPDVVKWAHDARLTVTPYTFRSSNTGTFPSVRDEMRHFLYTLGVDALFTDNPDMFPRN